MAAMIEQVYIEKTSLLCPPHRDSSFGDLIIRTSDGTEFHVDRKSISNASPIFADMFYLPQHPFDTGDKLVLDVVEPAAVWEHIIYMCQHPPEPSLPLEHVPSLLAASKKYCMTGMDRRMEDLLRRADYLDKKPLSVYALACAYGLPEVARLAARRTLQLPHVFEYVPELASITGRAYHRLLEYRQKCGLAARAAVARSPTQVVPAWVDEDVIKRIVICSGASKQCEEKAQYYYARSTDYHLRKSWLDYLDRLGQALEFRPDGSMACAPTMLEPVIVSAAECIACATRIYGQAIAFSKKVEEVTEEEISKIELVVDL